MSFWLTLVCSTKLKQKINRVRLIYVWLHLQATTKPLLPKLWLSISLFEPCINSQFPQINPFTWLPLENCGNVFVLPKQLTCFLTHHCQIELKQFPLFEFNLSPNPCFRSTTSCCSSQLQIKLYSNLKCIKHRTQYYFATLVELYMLLLSHYNPVTGEN